MLVTRLFTGTLVLSLLSANAAVYVVTTDKNVDPPAGSLSLASAISQLKDGDTIRFNIPGTNPHVIETPPSGYDYIRANNVTIDGYSQPGSSPNTNSILAPNNAKIGIVLDSRNGNYKLMDYAGFTPDDDTGFGAREAAILGVIDSTNLTVRGISFLSVPSVAGDDGDVSIYSVALARLASGAHLAGNWFGVAPDGKTVAGSANGISGFRYRGRDESGNVTNTITIDNTIVGVAKNATNAPAEFNIFAGHPAIPIILEGNGTRISGNFIMVLPNGTNDVNVTDLIPGSEFEGAIEIGRGGNNTVIGVDGDGVNDANERNVIGGTYPPGKGGYDHTIEFYGQTPGTNIVVAGNYIGIGIDGGTRFTNGVPALNASGGSAQFRFGSDFDGVSDALEGNVVANNWPAEIFAPSEFGANPGSLNFFDELSTSTIISFRGNTLINNFPAPASPLRNNGEFLSNYLSRVLLDISGGYTPLIATNSTTSRLRGTVPLPAQGYSAVVDLYTVDPEGIQTGQQTGVPEFAGGWVQGRSYLGSFTVDGPSDTNSAAGAFDFALPAGLAAGTQVTITANYIAGTPGTHNAPTVTSAFSDPIALAAGSGGGGGGGDIKITGIAQDTGGVRLTWTGGTAPFTVEKTTEIGPNAQWTAATTTSERTVVVPATGKTGFFRIR